MGFTVPDLVFWVFTTSDLVFWVFTISDLVFWILSSGFYCSGFGVPAFRILLYFTSCPKWQKNFVCCTPHLRKHTSYDCDFSWYLQGFFFIFSNIEKGKKMAQNDKKFCPSHPVSQELYIKLSSNCRDLWYTFINWWYFQQFFFLFFKFWFIGVLVRKKGKKWPKTANLSPLRSISQKL